LVSRGAEHAGQHGEYLESFLFAFSPTGRCRWLYFGTNLELEVENRAELNAGQHTDSYVASFQSFRACRYFDISGAITEKRSEAWTFLETVAPSTSSWHTADGKTRLNGIGAAIAVRSDVASASASQFS
jgi:hypothetical protein